MTQHPPTGDLRLRRARWSRLLWLALAVVVIAVAAWYATHPTPLPTTAATVTASTPVGEPVYVGVLAPTAEEDRTLVVRGFDVDATGDVPVDLQAKICRGGAIAVTSEPETFCTSLVNAVGTSIGPGDVLVLEISSTSAGEVELGRVHVTYREGLQWGSSEAGPPVTVTFLSR